MNEELPPEEAVVEFVDNRPIIEKIGDKNWKSRLSAYEELKKDILIHKDDKDSPIFTEFVSWLPKMTSDINAGALDIGFDVTLSFVELAPHGICLPYQDKLFTNIIDKAFSGKASTGAKGKALLLKLIEIDDASVCTVFLLGKLADKKPKIPPMCLEVLKEGIELFGIKAFPVKDILKALPNVFNGTNNLARDMAMQLLIEIYRWIGQAPIQVLLDSLRTAQKSDFENMISIKASEFKPLIPTLYLRKDRPAEGTVVEPITNPSMNTNTKLNSTLNHNNMSSDARDYVDEIDLIKKIKSTDFFTLVADEKWSEQLKGLQIVIDAIGAVPKVKADNDVHEIIAILKGFLRQGHLQLQISSLRIIALLADGLRSHFATTVRPVMQQIIMKFKEKRLVPEVQAVLHMVFSHCINYDSINEDIIELISSKKSPAHEKIGIMDMLIRTLTTFPEKISSDSLKPLATSLIGECEDSDPKVRESSVSTLAIIATVAKSRGRLAVDAYKTIMTTENTHPKVFKKIQGQLDGSNNNSNSTTTAESNAISDKLKTTSSLPVAAAAVTKKPVSSLHNTTSTLPKKVLSSTSTSVGANVSKKSSSTANNNAAEDDNVEDLALSEEDAITQLDAMLIPDWVEKVQPGMISSKWQDKVEALSILEQRILELQEGGLYSAALVKYLSTTSSGFKISNINILKATISTCCAAVKNVGSTKFSRPAAWELLKQFGDKLSDKKTKDGVQLLLSSITSSIGANFVIKRMKVVLEKTKAPLAHQYYLEWLKDAITEFGYSSFPVSQVGSCCQLEMENKVVTVRTAAVEVMGALYHQIGPKLSAIAFSDDMKPQIKALLEAEFVKVGHDPNAAKSLSNTIGGNSSGNGEGGIPRQDLCALLDKNILSELNFIDGKNSWQRRKVALEAIVSCCERVAHYLESNKGTGEILKALKPRMNDTQANLKPIAVSAIGHIIASLDADTSGAKVLRTMAAVMMLGLGDNKKSMRDSTIIALHHAVTSQLQPEICTSPITITIGKADSNMMLSILPAASEALVNPVGRQELLEWLLLHVNSLKGDWTELTNPLILALQDKAAVVRTAAEQLLSALLANGVITKSTLDKATRDLPPATKRAMQAAIDRMMAISIVAVKQSQSSQSNQISSVKMEVVPAQVATSASIPTQTNNSQSHSLPTSSTDSASILMKKTGILQPKSKSINLLSSTSTSSALDEPHQSSTSVLHKTSSIKSTPTRSSIIPATHNTPSGKNIPSFPNTTVTTTVSTPDTIGRASKWLLKRNIISKLRRQEDSHHSWPQPPELPGEAELLALKTIWKPLVTTDLLYLLFPNNNTSSSSITPSKQQGLSLTQDSFVPAINELITQLECPHISHHIEYILRWCSIVLCLKLESTSGLLRLLQFICDLFQAVAENMGQDHTINTVLTDMEASYLIPHLIEKLGHRSEKHQILFKKTISLVGKIMNPSKLVNYLIRGLKTFNKRSRILCLEELKITIESCIPGSVLNLINSTAVSQLTMFLDAKDCDIVARNTCLDVICTLFNAIGHDFILLKRLIGSDVSDTSLALIEDHIASRTNIHVQQEHLVIENEKDILGQENQDVWQLNDLSTASDSISKQSPSNVSPNSEMRSHRLLLEQIDAVMASTPLPSSKKRSSSFNHTSPIHNNNLTTTNNTTNSTHNSTTKQSANHSNESINNNDDNESHFSNNNSIVVETEAVVLESPPPTFPRNSMVTSSQKIKETPVKNSTLPHAIGSPITIELEGIYIEIESKIDALLNTKEQLYENDPIQEECKDYLKMLHSIIIGEWSTERLPEDEAVLLIHADELIERLLKCIKRSFDKPSIIVNTSSTSLYINDLINVDISLLAISLSALFALVKKPEVTLHLNESRYFDIFHECLLRICDERITNLLQSSATTSPAMKASVASSSVVVVVGVGEASRNEVKETIQQIVRAFNMIVLRLGVDGPIGIVLIVLIKIMFCCIPIDEIKSNNLHNTSMMYKALPSYSTKPTSRLIIQVLSEQSNKLIPYADHDISIKHLLETIHVFFTQHPTSTSDDTPFRTVKTILNEVIRVKGGYPVLSKLQECTEIPHTAFIYLLTCRLGNVQLQETDTVLHSKIVAIIDDITSSRDKLAAIKELHKIKQANPQLDINQYLLKISTAFRRYVLNTLSKLDDMNNNIDDTMSNVENQSLQSNTTTNNNDSNNNGSGFDKDSYKTKQYLLTNNSSHSSNLSNEMSSMDQANEALRLLESIKTRPQHMSESPSITMKTFSPHSMNISTIHSNHSSNNNNATSTGITATNNTSNTTNSNTTSTQKKFVLNPITKRMEMQVMESPSNNNTGIADNFSSSKRLVRSSSLSGDSSYNNTTSSNNNNNEISPFSKRNDIIRTSLNHLSAALNTLELPVTSISNNIMNTKNNTTCTSPATLSNSDIQQTSSPSSLLLSKTL